MKYVFTFGSNHYTQDGVRLDQYFVVLEGTFGETRDAMFRVRGNKWAFQYTWEEFEPQIEKYNLKRIDIKEVFLP